jgi:succinoglycan biosynthesis protein ExoA
MPIASKDIAGSPFSAVVVIPCLNEEEHIERTIAHFAAASPSIVCKIVVVDGGSTDLTLKVVQQCALSDRRVALIINDRRIQSSGINRAVEIYGDLAPFIVRADAHADYPGDFCERLLEAQKLTGADSIVVSMFSKGEACFQMAAAAAQNSKLGNGGSAHRSLAEGRFVDHGHHALMSVNAFRALGGYDETFSHNEDAELDLRLVAAGCRIYLCAGADITYYPRKGVFALFRQYINFGKGRAKTNLKHHARPKLRQVLPVMIGPIVAVSLLGWISPLLALPAAVWVVACTTYGILLGVREKSSCACGAGIAAMLMHLGFSVGYILQILKRAALGAGSRPSLGPHAGVR